MPDRPLDVVAETAEQVAADQIAVAEQAREMQKQHDQGWTWSQILDTETGPGIVERIRRSRQHLAGAVSIITSAIASGLTAEGRTRRQIAARLGVTHQRVSAILHRGNGSEVPAGK